MAATEQLDTQLTEYRKGTKVVLVDDLPGVPQGTTGKLGRSVGFDHKRYRVRFANDVELLSVPHDRLVPARQWPQYIADRRAAEAAVAEREAAAELGAAAPPLASSEAAPAQAATQPVGTAEAAGQKASEEAGDPRLAALLAKSKKAREASGVAAPAPSAPADPAPVVEAPAEAAPAESAPAVEASAESASAEEPHPMGVVEPAKADAPHGSEHADPAVELPEGYFPRDNRVAELLDKFRN